MSVRRRLLVVFLSLLLLSGALTPALAQTDLQRAKDEAEDAKRQADTARAGVRSGRAELSEAGARLAVAFADFSAKNEALQEVALTVATVEAELSRTEEELATARDQALEQAVEVYTSAVAGTGLFSLLAGASPAEAVATAGVLEDLAQAERSYVANYTALRADLDRRRLLLHERQAELAQLRSEAEAVKSELEGLYAELQEELAAAEARVRSADAAYAKALSDIEKERRRLAMLRGAESWRGLVSIYFPPELVDEALAIIQCESRGNPDAVHPTSGASGLFQFLLSTWGWASVEAGWSGASRFDPEANVAVAAWLVDVSIQTNHKWGRWGHWECRRVIYPKYTNGLAAGDGFEQPVAKLEDDVLV